MESEIGTLDVGKRADIILLDGDPTYSIYEMLKTRVVLKDGRIVVDKRAAPANALTRRAGRAAPLPGRSAGGSSQRQPLTPLP